MTLLRLSHAELHFGTQVILDNLDLTIAKGERLGLLGRNGVGKTTLFRVLTGEQQLDDGERWLDPTVKLARLEQELPIDCLLYTSPSPRDRQKSRMPSSA